MLGAFFVGGEKWGPEIIPPLRVPTPWFFSVAGLMAESIKSRHHSHDVTSETYRFCIITKGNWQFFV